MSAKPYAGSPKSATVRHERELESLVRAIDPDMRLAKVTELTGGVSSYMLLLELTGPSGSVRRVVARRPGASDWKSSDPSRSSADMEHRLAQSLNQLGIAVPRPLLLWPDSPDRQPVFVMEYVEGSTNVDEAMVPSAMTQMAGFLAALHDVDPLATSLPELPSREDPVVELPKYLASGEPEVRLARALEDMRYSPKNPASILHGDYWPGNVLWSEGQLSAVIDWEDAAVGDPVSDVAACRVEILCAYGEDAMTLFTEEYVASTTIDLDDLDLWSAYVSYSALASMDEWGLPPGELHNRRRQTRAFADHAALRLLERAAL